MGETTPKRSSKARKAQSERLPGETAPDLTKVDKQESKVEVVKEVQAEVMSGAAAPEVPQVEPVRQDEPPSKGTLLQQIMSIPSFRTGVISRVVKKLG